MERRLQLGVTPRPATETDDERMRHVFPSPRDFKVIIIVGANEQERFLRAMTDCQPAGTLHSGALLLCGARTGRLTGFLVEADGKRTMVSVATPDPGDHGLGGWWTWAAASPDGQTFLAQRTWKCEHSCDDGSEAFMIDAESGHPASLNDAIDGAVSTTALGWATDDRAIIFATGDSACPAGGAIYAVSVDADRTLITCTDHSELPDSLKPSLEPRSLDAITSALG